MTTPSQEYNRTYEAIERLQAIGLYVEISQEFFSVYKYSDKDDREYDCFINCRNVHELELLIKAWACAPALMASVNLEGLK